MPPDEADRLAETVLDDAVRDEFDVEKSLRDQLRVIGGVILDLDQGAGTERGREH